jgi:hypothetical protein
VSTPGGAISTNRSSDRGHAGHDLLGDEGDEILLGGLMQVATRLDSVTR